VRYLFPLLFVCFLLPTAAEASYRPAQYYHQQYRVDYHQQYRVARQMQAAYTARYVYRESQWGGRQRAPASHRHYGGYGHYSGACAIAAAKGGPCGCKAMKLSGLSDRRYWLVSNWRVFPRTSAHVGVAALWGNQHVEIVTAVNGDGTVNTAGSVGHSHVRIASLTFVDPHAGAGGVTASSAPASNAAEARAPVARAPDRKRAIGSPREAEPLYSSCLQPLSLRVSVPQVCRAGNFHALDLSRVSARQRLGQ